MHAPQQLTTNRVWRGMYSVVNVSTLLLRGQIPCVVLYRAATRVSNLF